MTIAYLSTRQPRWPLTDETELQRAVDEQVLEENHHVEIKRELDLGTSGKNRELARDLAALAVDGGTLIVGVAEDTTTNTFSLAPQPTTQVPERIEQIALLSCQPSLSVRARVIPSGQDPDLGYIVVDVPVSPAAPHMVDGRYYGRGERSKHALSDADVRRLHDRQRDATADLIAHLEQLIDADPVPPTRRDQAHLFLLAEPLTPTPAMLQPYLEPGAGLYDLISRGAPPVAHQVFAGSPSLAQLVTRYSRRADGAAYSSPNLDAARSITGDQNAPVHDVEFSDDGAVRITMTSLSRRNTRDGVNYLLESWAVRHTRDLIGLARQVADVTGYGGSWGLAVGATGLQGLAAPADFGDRASPFEVDTYRRTWLGTRQDLTGRPGVITNQLIAPFVRKLNRIDPYQDLLQDP